MVHSLVTDSDNLVYLQNSIRFVDLLNWKRYRWYVDWWLGDLLSQWWAGLLFRMVDLEYLIAGLRWPLLVEWCLRLHDYLLRQVQLEIVKLEIVDLLYYMIYIFLQCSDILYRILNCNSIVNLTDFCSLPSKIAVEGILNVPRGDSKDEVPFLFFDTSASLEST